MTTAISLEDFEKVEVHIGSAKSEVRVLGTESEQGVVLLQPREPVKNGDRVF